MKAYAHLSDFIELQKTKESHAVRELVGLNGWVVYINLLAYLKKHKKLDLTGEVYFQFELDTRNLTGLYEYDIIQILNVLEKASIFKMQRTTIFHAKLTEYIEDVSNRKSKAAYKRWNKS